MPKYSTILDKCSKIAKEREEQYGDAGECMELACKILDVAFGIKLTSTEFCNVMVATKLAREKFSHKEDNVLDTINYLAIGLNEKK